MIRLDLLEYVERRSAPLDGILRVLIISSVNEEGLRRYLLPVWGSVDGKALALDHLRRLTLPSNLLLLSILLLDRSEDTGHSRWLEQ